MLRLTSRVAAIAAMLAVSSVGSIVAFSGVASASAPTATCTGFSSNSSGAGTLSGCNDTKNTGGKGTSKTSKGVTTITWNKTGTTTAKVVDVVEKTDTKCSPKTDTEVKVTSTVTGGTGAAVKSIKKGQTSTIYICYNASTKKATVAPGEKFQI